jgi:hypothetical protein
MKRRIALLTFITFAAVSAGHLNAQNNSGTDLRVISTAYITKIDEKKMKLVVKSDPQAPNVAVGGGGAPRGSGGGGGGRRGGGVNVSGGGSRGGGRRGGGAPTTTAPTGTNANAAPAAPSSKGHEFKVSVTKETVVTDGDAPLPFSKLKVGDHIVISGISKGNDVEAESIQLDSEK